MDLEFSPLKIGTESRCEPFFYTPISKLSIEVT
jgi:hypothetical protein